MSRVYVWDIAVRVLHLLLIVGVVCAFVSYQLEMMEWHELNGYMLLGAVGLRVVWGFVGSRNARFSSFIKHPKVVLNYVRNWRAQAIGTTHNPLGGYAVLALLGAVMFQGITGLFATDDVLFTGPLYDYISNDMAEAVTEIHEASFFFVLLPLIAVHITAVFTYLLAKKINLITPMITGYRNEN